MKFVKNVISWDKTNEFVIVDIYDVQRCYICGAECHQDDWHPKLWHCENNHTVEIPCADWFIVFTVRPKHEIKITKNKPIGKTSVGRGSWTPETENDTNLRLNEQLLRFDYVHEIKEMFGTYLSDLITCVASTD